MLEPLLACTVRGCGLALTRSDRVFTCDGGHAYDIARSGYVNLLQPQDRRSTDAGDSKEVVAVRSRLIASGIGRGVIEAIAAQIAAFPLPDLPQVVDLGCGSGDALAAVIEQREIRGVGIDISPAAVEHAARTHPALTWVVANADRRLPLLDASVSVLVSLHGRRNPEECMRVLLPSGHLVVGVPARDDLTELRTAVQGRLVERDRVDTLVAVHAPFFEVMHRETVREPHRLTRDSLADVLRVTYRGERRSEAAAASALTDMDVTFASDLVAFRKRH